MTYHWKDLEESYNFVIESISIKAHTKKLSSHKVSNTITLPRNNHVSSRNNSLGRQLKLCSLEEQMCSKICVNIIFSYVFWLKCFSLQNYTFFQDLSNNKSQDYIKTTMRWLWLLKDSKHMFPQGTCAFPWVKFIVPQISWFFGWSSLFLE